MSWPALPTASNKFRQSYFQGFVDISGGGLILRNSDASFNGNILVIGNSNAISSIIYKDFTQISSEGYVRIGINAAGTTLYGLIHSSGIYTLTFNSGTNTWNTPTRLFAFQNSYAMAIASSESRGILLGQSSNAYYFNTNGTYTLFDSSARSYFGCDITADGNTIVASTSTGNDYIYYSTWNGTTFNTLTSITSTRSPVGVANSAGVSISPDGSLIAYGQNKTIYYAIWNGSTYATNTSIGGIPSQYTPINVKIASNYTLFCSTLNSSTSNIAIYYSTYNTATTSFSTFELLYQTSVYGNPPIGLTVDNLTNSLYVSTIYKLSYSVSYTNYSKINSNWITVGSNSAGQYGNYSAYVNGTCYIAKGITASATQLIDFGSNAPTMSGANIAAGTIPTSALSGGSSSFVDLATAQTIGGAKTFSSTMTLSSGLTVSSGTVTLSSGLTVSSGTVTLPSRSISDSALSTNVPLINVTNTFTGQIILSTPTVPDSFRCIHTDVSPNNYVFINRYGKIGYWNASSENWSIDASGKLNLSNGLTVFSGTVTLPSQSISDSALSTNVPLINGTNTFTGQIILSTPAVGDSLRCIHTDVSPNNYVFINKVGQIGYWNASYANWMIDASGKITLLGGITASATQTINFGSNAPTMSGANIAAGTIPANAVSGGLPYVDLTTSQTVGGAKSFTSPMTLSGGLTVSAAQNINFGSNAPTMSGANIAAGTIPTGSLSNGSSTFVDLTSGQTVGGAKTFSSAVTLSNGINVSSGTVTLPSRSISDSALSTNVPLINGTNTFTGTVSFSNTTPTAPTPSTSDNTTTLATTAYVKSNLTSYLTASAASSTYLTQSSASSTYAPLASPALTGTPTAPTPASNDNSTKIATTAYVQSNLSGISGVVDLTSTQTVTGSKTFSSVMTLNGGLTASASQTINFGTNAPTMSGENIRAGTISANSLYAGDYVNISSAQTISSSKTFTSPINIIVNSILDPVFDQVVGSDIPINSYRKITGNGNTTLTNNWTAYGGTNSAVYLINGSPTLDNGMGQVTTNYPFNVSNSIGLYINGNGTLNESSVFQTIPNITAGNYTIFVSVTRPNYTYIDTGEKISVQLITGVNQFAFNVEYNFNTFSTNNFLEITANVTLSTSYTNASFQINYATRSSNKNMVVFTRCVLYNNNTNTSLVVYGDSTIYGKITASSYVATSDRRLKENIEPLESQWSNILSVEPVSFSWKKSKRSDIGFIAQDIHAKYPYLRPNYMGIQNEESTIEEPVDLSGNPIYYGIDYGRMTPFLWKGLQETMQEIDSLKAENEQLKYLIHGLSQRISSLEYR